MPSWIVALDARAEVARSRAEGLREQIAGLTEELGRAESELSRLRITRETMEEVLAAPIDPVAPVASVPGPVEFIASVPMDGLARAASLLVAAEARGDATVTSPAYRRVVAVFAEASGPRRCKDVLAAFGTNEPSASQVETMRSKLKRLAERGVLVHTGPGQYVLAGGGAS